MCPQIGENEMGTAPLSILELCQARNRVYTAGGVVHVCIHKFSWQEIPTCGTREYIEIPVVPGDNTVCCIQQQQ